MLDKAQEKQIDKICEGMKPPQEKYWRAALTFMKDESTREQTVALTPEMAEWQTWKQYFIRHCGFFPSGMRMVLTNQCKTFLVPTGRPEWFDPTFRPTPTWKADARYEAMENA